MLISATHQYESAIGMRLSATSHLHEPICRAAVETPVTHGCEGWTIKKAEHQRIDTFEMWCWGRLLRVPWTARRSNQSILKKISPKRKSFLKLQYFGHLPHWKRPWCWERLKARGEGDDRGQEMVGWQHWLDGHEFEQAPGVGEGQGSLVCYSSWGLKESDTTEQLNWTA